MAQDPTRTTDIRMGYNKALRDRWDSLLRVLRAAILEDGLFDGALKANVGVTGETPWEISDNFKRYLARVGDNIIKPYYFYKQDTTAQLTAEHWQDKYVKRSYIRGIVHSNKDLIIQGVEVSQKQLSQILQDQFYRDSLASLYHRNYEALDTVKRALEEDTAQKVRETITNAYADRVPRREISRRLYDVIKDRVGKVAKNRSEMIARTEVVRAHSHATLDNMTKHRVVAVRAEVEFATAKDDWVCDICKFKIGNGKEFRVEEAYDIIPVHPRCRCTWKAVID